jgi:hypothetical protein
VHRVVPGDDGLAFEALVRRRPGEEHEPVEPTFEFLQKILNRHEREI